MKKYKYLLLAVSGLAVIANPKNIPASILLLLSGLILLIDAIDDIVHIIKRRKKDAER